MTSPRWSLLALVLLLPPTPPVQTMMGDSHYVPLDLDQYGNYMSCSATYIMNLKINLFRSKAILCAHFCHLTVDCIMHKYLSAYGGVCYLRLQSWFTHGYDFGHPTSPMRVHVLASTVNTTNPDLAYRMPINASETLKNFANPQTLTSGDMCMFSNDEACFATNATRKYVTVDLGQSYPIAEVAISSGQNVSGTLLTGINIYIGNAGGLTDPLVRENQISPPSIKFVLYTIGVSATGRYVTVEKIASGVLSMCHLRVYQLPRYTV